MKYYKLLDNIITKGICQSNKKGYILYLTNQILSHNVSELNELFNNHPIAKNKLKAELELYMRGETLVEKYKEKGIEWWNYCSPELINSYPTYFKKLPALIEKINKEKRNSKNYVLFIGNTDAITNQLPCLSLIQFQIENNKLNMTVYQRSADSNLGLPSDIFQMNCIADLIDIELNSITFFIGNAHIYENNVKETKKLLNGQKATFNLNV
jgi:thymidylate synthase